MESAFEDETNESEPMTIDEYLQEIEDRELISENYMEELCANIKVGDRCEVEPGAKRGVVKFVGQAESLAPGLWVGVQYDEPLGKHDGMSLKNTSWFQTDLNTTSLAK